MSRIICVKYSSGDNLDCQMKTSTINVPIRQSATFPISYCYRTSFLGFHSSSFQTCLKSRHASKWVLLVPDIQLYPSNHCWSSDTEGSGVKGRRVIE